MRVLPNHLQMVRAPRLKGLGGASGRRQEADQNDGLISLESREAAAAAASLLVATTSSGWRISPRLGRSGGATGGAACLTRSCPSHRHEYVALQRQYADTASVAGFLIVYRRLLAASPVIHTRCCWLRPSRFVITGRIAAQIAPEASARPCSPLSSV